MRYVSWTDRQAARGTCMYRPETSTVTGGHILVKACHGISTAELTEFLVHVVRARTRVVS